MCPSLKFKIQVFSETKSAFANFNAAVLQQHLIPVNNF